MKKILLALAIMPLFFVACSSDDDIPSSGNFDYSLDHLYGEWRVTDVEAIGTIDLTKPQNELYVTPTYLKFEKDGSLTGEGVLGEGTGKYSTKSKTIYTSLGKKKINLEVTSLNATTAKVKLDAKNVPHPLIKDDMGMVTLTLEKNYKRPTDDKAKLLYGKWRATSLEGIDDEPIDLTNFSGEALVKPTYLTFEERGAYTSEGALGNGAGRYVVAENTLYTLVKEETVNFGIVEIGAKNIRIEVELDDIDFNYKDHEGFEGIDSVILVLTKQ